MLKLRTAAKDDRLIEDNIPLVGYVVSEMHHRYPMVERDEMVSSGMEGLVLAAQTWNPDAGTQFSTWARLKIRWNIQELLQGLDWMGRRGRDRTKKMNAARETLTSSLGRIPTDHEVAVSLGITDDEVSRAAAESTRSLVPMDDALSELVAHHAATPEQSLVDVERDLMLHKAVQSLPERTREVIVLHYFGGEAQGDVARKLGVSDATVSNEKMKGLRLLQETMSSALEMTPAKKVTARIAASDHQEYLSSAAVSMAGGIVPRRSFSG